MSRPTPTGASAGTPPGAFASHSRILFLDDDHDRAHEFLLIHPNAVWVETVDDCLNQLELSWDEVHLDHDLGGERYVDFEREDCGMQIVRWLCLIPRPHLKGTKFFVHSHNSSAAKMMVMQIHAAGFQVEGRSFGSATPWFQSGPVTERKEGIGNKLLNMLAGFLRLINGNAPRRSS